MTDTAIKERPILFSAPMVKAILSGTKTQTRRIVKLPRWAIGRDIERDEHRMAVCFNPSCETHAWLQCPYAPIKAWPKPHYEAGTRLWVREMWRRPNCNNGDPLKPGQTIQYRATNPWHDGFGECWRPSIFMPRWASRITLEITDVRVQRLQEISEADAIAEGAQCAGVPASITNRGAFAKLWNKINGDGAWERNDWVWAISFRKLDEMTPNQQLREAGPPGSLLRGPCVVYEQDGRLWRCTAREWQRMQDEERRKTA